MLFGSTASVYACCYSPPSIALKMQIVNFIIDNKDEKNTHVKTTLSCQAVFEKVSRKRGFVVT